jgi:putative ABC transport system permease protein
MNVWARLLLRLFPSSFRDRYGDDLVATVGAEWRDARRRGAAVAIGFVLRAAADLAAAACRYRVRQIGLAVEDLSGFGPPQLPSRARRTAMDTLVSDLRYAIRQLIRRPGFTAIAVFSLGLAIGANSLIYGLLDGLVLRPFPYPDPDRLVAVGVTFPKLSAETNYIETFSPAEYADIRAVRSFAHAASFDLGNRNIVGGDAPERVFTALLLDDLFPVIGLAPALGRGFTREELAPEGPPVAIISHRLWQSRFGGDPGILDRPIRVSGRAVSIVGVMPPGLVIIGTDLWLPWAADPLQVPRNVRQFNVLARLAPGSTLAQANAELATVARRVEQAEKARFAEYENWQLTATPWAAALLRDVRPAAFILLGAVGLVLLIACANMANLFLARSSTRQRELAVRLALGAGRWRVTRVLLTESVLLALAGAGLGLAIAWAGLKSAGVLIPAQFQMLGLEAALNVRVLVWSLTLALGSGLAVGLVPALQAIRTDPHESLRADVRTGGSRAGRRVRQALVVAELTLSVVLLIGAGLLLRTFFNVQHVDRGFDSQNLLTMRLTLPRDRYPGEAAGAFFDRLSERLAALPGVRSVAAASQFPPGETFSTRFTLERAPRDGRTLPTALITVATPTYFDVLRVPLRSGRMFTPADRLDAPLVAIANQSFVDRHLAGADPIGQRLTLGSPDRVRPWITIVGVVADYRNAALTEPVRPALYTPVRQQTEWNQLFVLVRSDVAPASLLPTVRQSVTALDAEQPVYLARTMDDALAAATFQQRAAALLLGIFAAVALVLAAVGTYGVMAYVVNSRTQEIGVRLAVGAQRRDVIRLVLAQVFRLVAIGLAIGIAIVVLAGPALEGLLFGVRAADPATITLVALTLAVVALLAAWVPAARASRVDPIQALRAE